jgi:hypothetical protein
MTESAEHIIDIYYRRKYNIKRDFSEYITLKEKRRRLLEKIRKRYVPESAKAIDFVKLIREERERRL